MQQLAWLHARPKSISGKPGDTPRLQTLQARGVDPDLPDPGPAGYLAGYLWEIGPTVSGGMGPAPIGWRDMQAWQDVTGMQLQPWEARLLRQCSQVYIAQLHDAEAHDAAAPYTASTADPERRNAVIDRLGSILSGMATKPTSPRRRGGITT